VCWFACNVYVETSKVITFMSVFIFTKTDLLASFPCKLNTLKRGLRKMLQTSESGGD
jgi:hypothetical protein